VGYLFLSKANFLIFLNEGFPYIKPFDHGLLLVNWRTCLRTTNRPTIVLF